MSTRARPGSLRLRDVGWPAIDGLAYASTSIAASREGRLKVFKRKALRGQGSRQLAQNRRMPPLPGVARCDSFTLRRARAG